MRYSIQRNTILDVVKESSDHPDARTIYERVKLKIPNISLGTVYRNLNNLVAHNLIKKVSIYNDSDRFDKTICDHYHFYCNTCKKVYDITLKSENDINNLIEGDTNFKVNSFNILVDGICYNCVKKEG